MAKNQFKELIELMKQDREDNILKSKTLKLLGIFSAVYAIGGGFDE